MVELGVSGHYGKELFTYQLPNAPVAADPYVKTKLTSTIVAADLQIFVPYVEFRGEYFMATNADDMAYGAPGVFRPDDSGSATARGEYKGMKTKGGWAQINVIPTALVNVFAGYGFEDPDEGDLTAGAADVNSSPSLVNFRTKNVHLSGGVMLNVGKNWKAALEVTKVTTTYATSATATQDQSGIQTALSTQFIF
jgi:hypothetical protein